MASRTQAIGGTPPTTPQPNPTRPSSASRLQAREVVLLNEDPVIKKINIARFVENSRPFDQLTPEEQEEYRECFRKAQLLDIELNREQKPIKKPEPISPAILEQNFQEKCKSLKSLNGEVLKGLLKEAESIPHAHLTQTQIIRLCINVENVDLPGQFVFRETLGTLQNLLLLKNLRLETDLRTINLKDFRKLESLELNCPCAQKIEVPPNLKSLIIRNANAKHQPTVSGIESCKQLASRSLENCILPAPKPQNPSSPISPPPAASIPPPVQPLPEPSTPIKESAWSGFLNWLSRLLAYLFSCT